MYLGGLESRGPLLGESRYKEVIIDKIRIIRAIRAKGGKDVLLRDCPPDPGGAHLASSTCNIVLRKNIGNDDPL